MNERIILDQAQAIKAKLCQDHPDLAIRIQGIKIKLSRRMTNCAGKAWPTRGLIKLSVPFFVAESNASEFFNVVTHEIAHILVPSFRSYPGERRNPHGFAWQAMHRKLGGNGERCHTMEVAEAFKRERKPRQKLVVPCPNCKQDMPLGPTQYRRHMTLLGLGRQGYRHRQCTRSF